ncbi:MAG: helix-turn-helix transcriptional regulator [Bacilli bacterium]|jgi:DNA-binding XRE family transcriptional regulator
MKFIYRNNEIGFRRWAFTYIKEAERIVEMFPLYGRSSEKFYKEKQKEYEDAVRVLYEYNSLLLWLDEEETDIFQRAIVKNKIISDIKGSRVFLLIENVFKKWQTICFKNKKTRIKRIDNKAIGRKLKDIRNENFLTVTAVADALKIAPSTLRNYELGNRTISLNALYGLSQIYGVSIEQVMRYN